jgi:ribosomal protein S6E (S10)
VVEFGVDYASGPFSKIAGDPNIQGLEAFPAGYQVSRKKKRKKNFWRGATITS